MAQINFGGVNETVVTREEFPLEKARKVLENETIAVIGYGVQGPGQSLNLRDNGFNVIVGQREGTRSWERAVADGWVPGQTLFGIEEAAERCRFRDCSHEDEPGCAVRAAVESGDISEQRYASYQALRQETKDLRARREEARRMRGEKASDRGKTPKKGRPRKKR